MDSRLRGNDKLELLLTLIRYRIHLCLDLLWITEILTLNRLQVFIKIVNQRHTRRDIQTKDRVVIHIIEILHQGHVDCYRALQ